MSYGRTILRRTILFGVAAVCLGVGVAMLVAIKSQEQSYKLAVIQQPDTTVTVEPFPISVDPNNATITPQLQITEFYDAHLATSDSRFNRWWSKITASLQTSNTFQLLASSVSRIIVVWPGERTEQITQNIGDVLRWNAQDRVDFAALMQDNDLGFSQGFIPPGQYITHRNATPQDIAKQLQQTYTDSVTDRYTSDVQEVLPLSEALIIASLIQREASDFENMREVSGVIWNRLFIDMPLQLDASLQYVKAENPYEQSWWPAVRPADKFIDSDFNTYQNKGLPPEPIANPSVEAIVAALNPVITDCLYYFHSRTREYYCSQTYEQHVAKLREIY